MTVLAEKVLVQTGKLCELDGSSPIFTAPPTQAGLDRAAALDLQIQLDAERRNHAITRAQMLDERGTYQREITELKRQLQAMEGGK